jgi:hypothetical protein
LNSPEDVQGHPSDETDLKPDSGAGAAAVSRRSPVSVDGGHSELQGMRPDTFYGGVSLVLGEGQSFFEIPARSRVDSTLVATADHLGRSRTCFV